MLQAIAMIQLAAVIWKSETQIKDWDRFYILWSSIEYMRLDPICTELIYPKIV